jgi:hypothetical protein
MVNYDFMDSMMKRAKTSVEGVKSGKERLALLKKELAEKNATKLPTEKRHKEDYKRVKGNIQKSRSDLHVNKKTGKREITTDMVIHKGLTAKEKAGLKKSILNAVKRHLSGSGLHIPLSGHYTSSLIFHEMGKYIPPKDRKLMKKLIEESKPPRPPPIHSGAIDEEIPLVEVPPMDSDSDYDSEQERHERRIRELNDSDSETDSEQERHERRIRELNDPDSDSDSDSDYGLGGMFGHGLLDNPMQFGVDKAIRGLQKVGQPFVNPIKNINKSLNNIRAMKKGTGVRRTKLHNNGESHPVLKRPRGRPRKIKL